MPGVQKPHWRPWFSVNARCTGCRVPSGLASDSTVVTSAPSSCAANIRHARVGSPSTSTVHAPHAPCSQPAWAPVRASSSRRKSSSSVRGSTSTSCAVPLTVTAMRIFSGIPFLRA